MTAITAVRRKILLVKDVLIVLFSDLFGVLPL